MAAHPRWSRVTAWTAAVVAGLLVGPLSPSPATAAADDVVLIGHGYGHGRGLGQYGSYGYAVDHGWTSAMILDHFYGGTKAGTVGNPNITVRLSSIESSSNVDTWITSDEAFKVGTRDVGAGSAARVVWTASGWAMYTKFEGCTTVPKTYGPYSLGSAPTLPITLSASPVTLTDLPTVCDSGRGYRGTLTYVRDGSTNKLVNRVPLQSYLKGVVPRESPASWGDARSGWGIEALKAQAVAARSYAWASNRYSYAKLCDTESCQVYGGAADEGVASEDSRTNSAVDATSGLVRVNKTTGAVVSTEFSSGTGGYTAGGAFPAVVDDGDRKSPNASWTVRLSGSSIAGAYGVGTFRQLKMIRQNTLGAGGGRVLQVDVIGSTKTVHVTGDAFRLRFGLKSDWFFPVIQPTQQVSSVKYRKLAFSDVVYRQVSGPSYSPWTQHAGVTAADYIASGRPAITPLASSYVKYAWSNTVYAVTTWEDERLPQVDMLTYDQWKRAGFPSVRKAVTVYGTMYYKIGSNPALYAEGPDEIRHHMTYSEWVAAGKPAPVVRPA
jgi:SpoIID/LytB domain protein